jgi:metal-responsive CopG/Arc/MetJ family transcriptional regulator
MSGNPEFQEVISMKSDNMVRRQLYLPQDLNSKLKGWAREKKISESEIMREALTQFLEREKRRATLPEDNPVTFHSTSSLHSEQGTLR